MTKTTTVKMDAKGRIMIPKWIRKAVQLKEGSYLNIRSKGKTVILEAAEPVADKYFGIIKITNWPKNLDLDEYAVEAEKIGASEIVSNDKQTSLSEQ